jgi:hypothetical protein
MSRDKFAEGILAAQIMGIINYFLQDCLISEKTSYSPALTETLYCHLDTVFTLSCILNMEGEFPAGINPALRWLPITSFWISPHYTQFWKVQGRPVKICFLKERIIEGGIVIVVVLVGHLAFQKI